MTIRISVAVIAIAMACACNSTKSSSKEAPPNRPVATTPTTSDAGPPATATKIKKAPATTPAGWGPVSVKVSNAPDNVAKLVKLVKFVGGLKRPVALEVAPGDSTKRLFVLEQHVARIRIVRGGVVDPKPFMSLGRVSMGNEQGLLGLAFHPKFATNRKFYINYTDTGSTTHVVEYKVSKTDANKADMSTAREVFKLKQPWSNHNGGGIEFGPDGKLYIGTGDGGAANDMLGAGQDRKRLLAKMLRLDVDKPGSKPEIVAIGLRNPWRFAFDSKTKDLYIGDVGQNLWEEIDVVSFGTLKPLPDAPNFGWNTMEGTHCFNARSCNRKNKIMPAVEFGRGKGCSITGGEVYRGKAIPELDAAYFYGDFCTGLLRSFRWSAGGVHQHWDWRKALDPSKKVTQISSFGLDHDGEMYILSLEGVIFKLVRR